MGRTLERTEDLDIALSLFDSHFEMGLYVVGIASSVCQIHLNKTDYIVLAFGVIENLHILHPEE